VVVGVGAHVAEISLQHFGDGHAQLGNVLLLLVEVSSPVEVAENNSRMQTDVTRLSFGAGLGSRDELALHQLDYELELEQEEVVHILLELVDVMTELVADAPPPASQSHCYCF